MAHVSGLPPIVYLPGASGQGSVWKPVAERLAKRREPILCDYPGLADCRGHSNIQSLADLARSVLEHLPARFDLAALSMGGALALWIAIEHPERVQRLVLVTTAGGVDVVALGGLDWRPAFRARRPSAPPWFVDDYTDFSEQLKCVAVPTLLVFGEADLIAPPAVGEYLCARLPQATLEVVPRATHDLETEYPDLLASLMEAHLRKSDRQVCG